MENDEKPVVHYERIMGVKPSIGRIVIYKPRISSDLFPAPLPMPAIIQMVHVPLESCNLAIFSLTGVYMMDHVYQGDAPGEWNWPVRE